MAKTVALYQVWARQYPRIGSKSLAMGTGQRHAAAGQTPPTPFAASHTTRRRDSGGTPRRPWVDALRITQMQRRWSVLSGNTWSNPEFRC